MQFVRIRMDFLWRYSIVMRRLHLLSSTFSVFKKIWPTFVFNYDPNNLWIKSNYVWTSGLTNHKSKGNALARGLNQKLIITATIWIENENSSFFSQLICKAFLHSCFHDTLKKTDNDKNADNSLGEMVHIDLDVKNIDQKSYRDLRWSM